MCEPQDASSFQFHARIVSKSLHVILKRSGMDGVYITPKSETLNRADEHIVWMPNSTLAQVKEFAKELEWHLGVARTGHENTQWGIRVNADDFAKTYTKAFPLKQVPQHLVTHFLAKISPVPIGASRENIKTSLQVQKIQGKPIRPLNPSAWLLSTVERMSKKFLTWGSDAIIVTPIQSWQERTRPTVVAGMQSKPKKQWESFPTEEDPLQHHDPWAEWSAASSSAGGSSSSRDGAGQVAKQQTELDLIQARLKTLESKSDIAEKNNQAWKQTMTKDFRAFKDEVKLEVSNLEKRLQSALSTTEGKLEQSLTNAVDQLKNFILMQGRQPKRQNPPSPTKSDEDMGDESQK